MTAPTTASTTPQTTRPWPAGSTEQHAWERGMTLWDGYFALVLVGSIVIVWLEDAPGSVRTSASILLALLAPAYVLLGRPGIVRNQRVNWRGLGYVAVAGALFAVSAALVQASWFALFILTAHIFMLLPTRTAATVVITMNLAPGLWLLSNRNLGAGVAFVAIAIIVTTFSLVFGSWVERIVIQSRERAELIEQLEATRAELATAHHRAGMLAERQRLSGEIHDTLAQGFTSILMLLQAAEPHAGDGVRRPLELAARTARENLAEARALVAALGPPALGSAPLAEAVRRLTERLGEEIDGATSYETRGEPRTLPAGAEVVLLRAAQEALANVRKHAGAGHVAVEVSYEEDAVRLGVRDDGAGFEPAALDAGTREHWGLRGMRDRVGQVGGSMVIDSSPGRGTALTIEVPA